MHAGSLGQLAGTLNVTEPVFMFLVSPVLFLLCSPKLPVHCFYLIFLPYRKVDAMLFITFQSVICRLYFGPCPLFSLLSHIRYQDLNTVMITLSKNVDNGFRLTKVMTQVLEHSDMDTTKSHMERNTAVRQSDRLQTSKQFLQII